MLRTRIRLEGTDDSVSRPIIIGVINDLKEILGIKKDVYVQYDELDKFIKAKNRLGQIVGRNTITNELIIVSTEEISEEDNALEMTTVRPDFPPVYVDKEIKASFRPIYHNRKVMIKFRYITKSQSQGRALIDTLRMKVTSGDFYNRHRLEYYFTVPRVAIALIHNINDLKELRNTSKKPFLEYIHETFDSRVDLTHSHDANPLKTELVVREAQLDTNGYYKSDLHDINVEYEHSESIYSIELEYEFIYSRPVALELFYPVLVFNRPINEEFYTFVQSELFMPAVHRVTKNRDIHDILNPEELYWYNPDIHFVRIPSIDTTQFPPAPLYYIRVFTTMIMVDDYDPTLLFNIHELDDIKFKPALLDLLLKYERKYINRDIRGIFCFELYKDGQLSGIELELSEDGVLRSKQELHYKSLYHVSCCIILDLDALSPQTHKRLKDFITEEMEALRKEKVYKKDINANPDYRETVIDIYANLIGVNEEKAYGVIKTTPDYRDIVFKLWESYKWAMKTKQVHHNIAALLGD